MNVVGPKASGNISNTKDAKCRKNGGRKRMETVFSRHHQDKV